MLTDSKIVEKEILALLKSSTSGLSFFQKGKLVGICNWEHIQVTDLIEGDYSDSFNYVIKGKGGIGILTEEMGCLTEQRLFQLTIKVVDDDVVAIKDNRVDIY